MRKFVAKARLGLLVMGFVGVIFTCTGCGSSKVTEEDLEHMSDEELEERFEEACEEMDKLDSED